MNTIDRICDYVNGLGDAVINEYDKLKLAAILTEHDAEQQAEFKRLAAELAEEKVRNPMNAGNLDVDEFYKEFCPRCGEPDCHDPDSKTCSDNCITTHKAKIAEHQAKIEGLEAELDDANWMIGKQLETLGEWQNQIKRLKVALAQSNPHIIADASLGHPTAEEKQNIIKAADAAEGGERE